jgi:hydroxyacylglutathione hydrolase
MRTIQLPLLQDNYGYLIVCEQTQEAAIVDPSEGEPVLSKVAQEKVRLKSILNTHHHWDHTGGNPRLLQEYPLEVYGHKTDKTRIPGITHPLEENDEVRIGELRGSIFFIPGHTRGHIAYLFENSLFCGDTLFAAGCGRLFEGTAEQMHDSLNKLKDLPDDTLIYCGHEYTEKNLEFAKTLEPGNRELCEKLERVRSLRAQGVPTVPSTMKEERATNPFLRWDSKEIQENLKKNVPDLALDPVSVFSRIRELKDRF